MLTVEFSRLFAGKKLYNNNLQSHSREFITLKGIKLTPLIETLEKIRNDSTGKERKTVLKAILLCFFFVKPKTEAEN